MDTLIKIMFLISLFFFNYSVLKMLYNMNDTKTEEFILYLVCGIDIASCVAVLANFHPDLGAGLTILCGCISALVVFVASAKLVVETT